MASGPRTFWLTPLVALALFGLPPALVVANPGAESRLTPCPNSPNCVSSLADDASQRIAPLRYDDDIARAHARLLGVLNGMARVSIAHREPDFIRAEFRSALFGFVDVASFHFAAPGVIEIRSAARSGYYDFGVNRQRLETIRTGFSAAAGASS